MQGFDDAKFPGPHGVTAMTLDRIDLAGDAICQDEA